MMMSRSFIKNSIESIEWSYNDYSCTISDALFFGRNNISLES